MITEHIGYATRMNDLRAAVAQIALPWKNSCRLTERRLRASSGRYRLTQKEWGWHFRGTGVPYCVLRNGSIWTCSCLPWDGLWVDGRARPSSEGPAPRSYSVKRDKEISHTIQFLASHCLMAPDTDLRPTSFVSSDTQERVQLCTRSKVQWDLGFEMLLWLHASGKLDTWITDHVCYRYGTCPDGFYAAWRHVMYKSRVLDHNGKITEKWLERVDSCLKKYDLADWLLNRV